MVFSEFWDWDWDRFFKILGLGLGSIFQNFGNGMGLVPWFFLRIQYLSHWFQVSIFGHFPPFSKPSNPLIIFLSTGTNLKIIEKKLICGAKNWRPIRPINFFSNFQCWNDAENVFQDEKNFFWKKKCFQIFFWNFFEIFSEISIFSFWFSSTSLEDFSWNFAKKISKIFF